MRTSPAWMCSECWGLVADFKTCDTCLHELVADLKTCDSCLHELVADLKTCVANLITHMCLYTVDMIMVTVVMFST